MSDTYIRESETGLALAAPRPRLSFFHIGETAIAPGQTAFDCFVQSMGHNPPWLRLAMKIRDRISALAGVAPIHGLPAPDKTKPPRPGDKLGFFPVLSVSDDELVLGGPDTHLSVVTVFRIERGAPDRLQIVSSVETYTLFGRLYMIPVAPAHRLIVAQSLRQLT